MGAACSKQNDGAKNPAATDATTDPAASPVVAGDGAESQKVYTEDEIKALSNDTTCAVVAGGRVFKFDIAAVPENLAFVKERPGADVTNDLRDKGIDLATIDTYRIGFVAPPQ